MKTIAQDYGMIALERMNGLISINSSMMSSMTDQAKTSHPIVDIKMLSEISITSSFQGDKP